MQSVEQIKGPIEQYFDQVFPMPPVILGRQLLPLSIGRYRLMAWRGCAFVADEPKPATAKDLTIGMVICSMTVSDFEQFIRQSNCGRKIIKWGQKVGLLAPTLRYRPFLWLWRRLWPSYWDRLDRDEINAAMVQFQKYVNDSQRVPDYWDNASDGEVSAAHWSHNIEIVLRGNVGWSEKEINEASLGKALFDYFKYVENQGLISIMNEDEIKSLRPPELSPDDLTKQQEATNKILLAQKEIRSRTAKFNRGEPDGKQN